MTERITTAEVGVILGSKPGDVEAEVRSLDMVIAPDWAGRPSLSVDDARSLVSGDARRTRDHEAAWAKHVAAERAWHEARTAAGIEAAAEVRAAHTGPADGESVARASAAAVKATRRFEKSHPRPRFPGLPAHKVAYP